MYAMLLIAAACERFPMTTCDVRETWQPGAVLVLITGIDEKSQVPFSTAQTLLVLHAARRQKQIITRWNLRRTEIYSLWSVPFGAVTTKTSSGFYTAIFRAFDKTRG
ncbi:hypothetical protein JG688_00008825 [Phytophthora aleatoria]|uniref:Uncharacterized protein n=1 Tax=Phytophthora aleatoria TaxID=2496075 RepID=A0A8J5IHH5_9STRA|nr:hypothetical protein JG688_00008825 [Phytophthora aleatoria]